MRGSATALAGAFPRLGAAPFLDLGMIAGEQHLGHALAGYGGLVSIGQQAFFGLGAYFVLILAIHGTSPFAALPVAAIGCGVVALPMWWLVSRLRSGYFAIATWVLAATIMLIIERFSSIGGGTGMPLPGFAGLSPALLTADTYWAALAVTVLALVATYLLLRGRLGLTLTAIRDDEVAARSSGVVAIRRVRSRMSRSCSGGSLAKTLRMALRSGKGPLRS